MIAIESSKGYLLRSLSPSDGKVYEYHPLFGFVSEESFQQRKNNRKRHGLIRPIGENEFKFKFTLQDSQWVPEAIENCKVEKTADSKWNIISEKGAFAIRPIQQVEEIPFIVEEPKKENDLRTTIIALLIFLSLIGGMHLLHRLFAPKEVTVVEQVTVSIPPPPPRQAVVVPSAQAPTSQKAQTQNQINKAMRQSVGFLGLLGRKDLNKAMGGAPVLKDASAGAGHGGTQGSGGEELYVGMGQGLRRSTIGNSGVAGLGGIGTKGAGGGQGGYGNSAIGGPGGKALATGPLSQDIILEGGLDAAVVQATIAKYLSQVRACYETGLARNAGLGGFVNVAFEIGASGNLNYSKVKESTLNDHEVEQCITTRMMGWKFPLPRGGVNVKVNYPFLLRSANS